MNKNVGCETNKYSVVTLSKKLLLLAFLTVSLSYNVSASEAKGDGAILITADPSIKEVDDIKNKKEENFWYPLAKKLTPSSFDKHKNRFLNFIGDKGIKVEMQFYKYGNQTKNQDHFQQKMIFTLDDVYINKIIEGYMKKHTFAFNIQDGVGGKGEIKQEDTLSISGDGKNITTTVDKDGVKINLKTDLQDISKIRNDKEPIEIHAGNKKYIFGGGDSDDSVLTKKEIEGNYALKDASNVTSPDKWRDKLDIYSKSEIDGKGIKIVGTDGKEHDLKLDKVLEFTSTDSANKDIEAKVTGKDGDAELNLKLNKSEEVKDGDQKAVTSDAVYKKLKDLETNLTKKVTETEISYKANGKGDHKVRLDEGFNFVDSTNLKAKVGENGQIQYELNKELKDINSISSGNNEFTIKANGKTYTFGGEDNKDTDIVTKKKLDDELAKKADLNAENLDNKVGDNGKTGKQLWQEKLGDGQNKENDKGLVNGNTLFEATNGLAKKSDLDKLIDKKKDTLFKITVDKQSHDVKYDSSLEFKAGKNLKVEYDNGIKYSMVENPEFESIKVGDVKLEGSSSNGLKLSKDGKEATIENITSGIEWKNDDSDKLLTPLKDQNGDKLNNVVTVKDLQKLASSGITFKADDNKSILGEIGKAITLQGKEKDNHQNVKTSVNPGKGVDIELNDDIKIDKSLTVGKKGSDSSVLTSDSLEFKDKDGNTKFKINSDGTMTGNNSNSGNSIATIEHVNKFKTELSQGVASVSAMTNIPQVQAKHSFSVGAGVGHYKGKVAGAIGVSGQNKSENVVYKASVGFDGTNPSVGAGMNYNFGKKQKDNNAMSDLEDRINSKLKALDEKLEGISNINNISIDNSGEIVKEQMYVISNFVNNSSKLTNLQLEQLQSIVNDLNDKYKGKAIDIIGYSDTISSDKQNLEIGLKRARQVQSKLRELGLDDSILIRKVSSFGYNNIIDTNKTKEGRQNNRRVEIFVK